MTVLCRCYALSDTDCRMLLRMLLRNMRRVAYCQPSHTAGCVVGFLEQLAKHLGLLLSPPAPSLFSSFFWGDAGIHAHTRAIYAEPKSRVTFTGIVRDAVTRMVTLPVPRIAQSCSTHAVRMMAASDLSRPCDLSRPVDLSRPYDLSRPDDLSRPGLSKIVRAYHAHV
eukprot:3350225-Rhodomonas_salina.1